MLEAFLLKRIREYSGIIGLFIGIIGAKLLAHVACSKILK